MSITKERLFTAAMAGMSTEQIVDAWHALNHPGAFEVCERQPCHAIAAELSRTNRSGLARR